MLALRKRARSKRPGEGGGGGGGGGGIPANMLLAAGRNKAGKLGLGFTNEDFYSFFQGVPGISGLLQVAGSSAVTLMLDYKRRLYVAGNGNTGAAGLGYPEGEGSKLSEQVRREATGLPSTVEDPTRITGGVPLYPEVKGIKTKGETWTQRLGPVGPLLPSQDDVDAGHATWTMAAVAAGASHWAGLTTDGRAVACGSENSGALGNGTVTDAAGDSARARDEIDHGEYPQFAPFWVLTGPGPGSVENPAGRQEVAPGETNVLKNVVALDCGDEITAFLVKVSGRNTLFYAGGPAGPVAEEPGGTHRYAKEDPVWAAYVLANPGLAEPIALSVSKRGIALLLADGTPRFVGNNTEYIAGTGTEKSPKTNVREVLVPTLEGGGAVTGLVAVSISEYAMKLLKSNGVLLTAGSDVESQQGLGLGVACQHCTPITSLNAGGRKVIAVSSAGEGRGTGRNGSDQQSALLDNHTMRTWGWNFDQNTGVGERYEGNGTLATGDSGNRSEPVEPLGEPQNVTQIVSTCVTTLAVQEGSPPSPSVAVSRPSPGLLLVRFTPPPGTVGSYPLWRAVEGWRVKLTGEGALEGLHYDSGPLAANATEYLFSVATGGTYEVAVLPTQLEVRPTITGGTTKTGAGGKLKIDWSPPAKAVPALFVQWRRTGTYTVKGKVLKDDWRREPNIAGNALSYLLELTASPHGVTGEEVEVDVVEDFRGAWGTKRTRRITLP